MASGKHGCLAYNMKSALKMPYLDALMEKEYGMKSRMRP